MVDSSTGHSASAARSGAPWPPRPGGAGDTGRRPAPRHGPGALRGPPARGRQVRDRDHEVGRGQRHPPVGRQGVVRDAAVAIARIGVRDPQARDRTSAEHGDRVDRLTGGHPREPPAGPGAEVARTLGNHDQVGTDHTCLRGEQPGVHRDCLQVTAERLADGDRRFEPARGAQGSHGAGEPGGQGTAVRHHVGDPRRPRGRPRALPSSHPRGSQAGRSAGPRPPWAGPRGRRPLRGERGARTPARPPPAPSPAAACIAP